MHDADASADAKDGAIKKYMCIVDVDPSAVNVLEEKAGKEGLEMRKVTHRQASCDKSVPWEDRAKKVEELLTLYQNANCVVTSRLHCALPCLALGTPVLLMRTTLDNVRFQPYIQWLHTMTLQDMQKNGISYSFIDPPANPDTYLDTRNRLIEMVQNFVERADTMENRFSIDALSRLIWQREVLCKSLEKNLMAYKSDTKAFKSNIAKYKKKLNHEGMSLPRKACMSLLLNGPGATWQKIKNKLRKVMS